MVKQKSDSQTGLRFYKSLSQKLLNKNILGERCGWNDE